MIDEKQLISHLYQNRENGQWMIQTNDEHQKGVADMAASFAGQFGLPSWGRALGLLHDKGKERAAFQQYIRKMNGCLRVTRSAMMIIPMLLWVEYWQKNLWEKMFPIFL